MVQFYDTYSSESFGKLVEQYGIQHYLSEASPKDVSDIVPFQTAQIGDNIIVPFEMAQIPSVLFATGWTNHQIIMNRCKSDLQMIIFTNRYE